MFNSGIKGNQRCNGIVSPAASAKTKTISHTNYIKLTKPLANTHDRCINANNTNHRPSKPSKQKNDPITASYLDTKVKIELDEFDIETKIPSYSITDGDTKPPKHQPPEMKAGRDTHHETLQRIDPDPNHYQRHWFSASLERPALGERSREERMEITRHELARHLRQLVRSRVGVRRRARALPPPAAAASAAPRAAALVAPARCSAPRCARPALPCARHCALHIVLNGEQVLFGRCTAKFADNTQCAQPVFDVAHEMALCAEHARKRDNYRLHQEAKPKKLRKKVKPSAMIRPQKRSKKRRRAAARAEGGRGERAIGETEGGEEVVVEEVVEEAPVLEVDMHIVDQVLGLNERALEQVLVTQNNLLEETDISTVLSTIQVDEFSDFFAVNRNGEYEPSREEAEELEKALAAVDNDVKSLEKLTQSQGLLDSLLDEHTLAESLVQIPDVFHNGYTTPSCGDSMVAQTSSFLLPVESQSHS